jgi:hypothetical protein
MMKAYDQELNKNKQKNIRNTDIFFQLMLRSLPREKSLLMHKGILWLI